MAAAVSTADHRQIGPLGQRIAADRRGAAFLTVALTAFVLDFLAAFAATPFRTEAFCVDFFATLFFKTPIFVTIFLVGLFHFVQVHWRIKSATSAWRLHHLSLP